MTKESVCVMLQELLDKLPRRLFKPLPLYFYESFNASFRNPISRFKARQRRRFQPSLLPAIVALEQRILLSGLIVTNALDNTSPGSLRWAVGQANATSGADTITFDPSIFATPKTITLTAGQLEMTDPAATTITGPAAGVTVSGNSTSRVFQIDAGVTATISGMTISGGTINGNGGGLKNLGTVTLTDCTVSGNTASGLPSSYGSPTVGTGGGLENRGTATLTDCTISGNTAGTSGGGLLNSGTIALTRCTVTGNYAFGAGGGLTSYGQVTLSDCTVSGNTAFGVGGGLFIADTATLTHCTVSGNTAAVGGGLFNFGQITLTDCAVSGNTASIGAGLVTRVGTATLTNCTVSGNTASFSGGGLYIENGTATLTNCTVSGNTTDRGGGLFIGYHGLATLTDCTVSGNAAAYGGGLMNDVGQVTLTDCTISGNTAYSGPGGGGYGGGLETGGGQLTLTDCTVSGNTASRCGGGLFDSAYSTMTLTNCTVSGNSASYGGGLYNCYQGIETLTNCTVSGNTASQGGGLYNGLFSTATLTNCTVSGNAAFGGGGGLFNFYCTVMLTNTIVAGNTSPSGGSDIKGAVLGSHNLIGAGGSGGLVNGSSGNIVGVSNALLFPLGDYGGPTQTMPLLPGCLAINAGAGSAGIPATDQRGLGRVGNIDIGAFESQGFSIAVASGSGQFTDISTTFSAPLVVKVTGNNPSEPVAGGLVIFTPPASGASAILGASPATISAAGTARVTATANGTSGIYTVSATPSGSTSSASFSLANRPTITVLAAQTAWENVDQIISGISIGDAPSVTLKVTLVVSHGTLTLGRTIGLTVTGNGSSSVTLIGTQFQLDAALAALIYRGTPGFIGSDTLRITATDGSVSAIPASVAINVTWRVIVCFTIPLSGLVSDSPASVAINVTSIGQQAAGPQAQASALPTAGVLNTGQANSRIVKLNPMGSNGESGKVQDDLTAGILNQAPADALLRLVNMLLLSLTRQQPGRDGSM